jgi:predicted AAA+ superfamily ATPase
MDKQYLMQIILDQRQVPLPEALVERWQYTSLLSFVNNPQVIVISGIRRCGKSVLLHTLRNQAKESDYYINFDDDRLVPFALTDFDVLLEAFIELFGVQNTFYFDEIQNIEGWERFVRRLHNAQKKVFVTGSNAKLLSAELGTRLTGRHITVNLFPYSFREYIQHRAPSTLDIEHLNSTDIALLKKYFSEFMKLGGFPEYLLNEQKEYLHQLYENILYKDIIVRNRIPLEKPIKELVYYLASNNCKEFTYNSLRKLIGLASANTVSDYCHHLETSFLCFTLNRFSYSLKEQVHYAKKIYFIDQALAETVGFKFSEDHGRVLENVVFLQLKRQSKEIYFHKLTKECDFLIREAYHVSMAIQVCVSLKQQETRQREINGLLEAMDLYKLDEGVIITEDEEEQIVEIYNSKRFVIKVIPCWKWLYYEDALK